MIINGLENDYYLSQNDIWISVNGFSNPISVLKLTVKNLTNGKTLPAFQLSPSPNNDFAFNICTVIRALFPNPDHINNNSLQRFQIDFNAIPVVGAIETTSLIKNFIRGGIEKNATDEWFLQDGQKLVIGKWVEWSGISLPNNPQKINENNIVEFVPDNVYQVNVNRNCNPTILKFLNSIGGYQFYVFDKTEKKSSVKPLKTIPNVNHRLRVDNFRNLGNDSTKEIELTDKTPFEIQEVVIDLIQSTEILLYNPNGNDDDSRWERLELKSNNAVENNWDRIYENKISFSFGNRVKRRL